MTRRSATIVGVCFAALLGFSFWQTTVRSPNDSSPYRPATLHSPNALIAAQPAPQEGVIDVRSYGAVGDGVTDDTAAVQTAIKVAEAANGATVYFPPGRYRMNITLDEQGNSNVSKMPMLRGSGPYATFLRSHAPGRPVIKVTGGASWSWPWAISDLTIYGYANAIGDSNGLETPDHSGVLALRCENVAFRYCNYGVHNHGELWYTFENCTFKANNIGFCGESTTARDNHGGCGFFAECNFQSNYLAAIYLNGTAQMTFTDCINEDNPGLGFLILNGSSAHPVTFRNTWFESNGTANIVQIDGATYVLNEHPVWKYAGWIKDGGVVLFENLNVPPMKILGYSFVQAERCHFRYADLISTPDPDTVFAAPQATYWVTNNSHGWPNNYYSPDSMLALADRSPDGYDSNNVKMAWRTKVTDALAWDARNLLGNGSCSTPFPVESANGNRCSFVKGRNPPLWGTCLQLNLRAGQMAADAVKVWTADIALVKGKWYVFTFDVRSDGEDGHLAFFDRFGGNSVFFDARPVTGYHNGLVVSKDNWHRYTFVRQSPQDGLITEWKLYNPGSSDSDFFIADAQFLEFNTAQAAYEFLCRSAYTPSSEVSRSTVLTSSCQTETVNISSAEIKALRSSPKQLVAAPGAGKWIEFVGASLWLDCGSDALVESADDLLIEYDNGNGATAGTIIGAKSLIAATSDAMASSVPVAISATGASNIINKNLALRNIGDEEYGGNASNDAKLRVIVAYRIHNVAGL